MVRISFGKEDVTVQSWLFLTGYPIFFHFSWNEIGAAPRRENLRETSPLELASPDIPSPGVRNGPRHRGGSLPRM